MRGNCFYCYKSGYKVLECFDCFFGRGVWGGLVYYVILVFELEVFVGGVFFVVEVCCVELVFVGGIFLFG